MKKVSTNVRGIAIALFLTTPMVGFSQPQNPLPPQAQAAVPWDMSGNANAGPTSILGATNAFPLNFVAGSTIPKMTLNTTGFLGIGTTSPASMFSVGTSSQFQVNTAGDLVRINNVPYSFPASQGAAGTKLQNDGSGNLSWAGTPASGVCCYWDLGIFGGGNRLRNVFFSGSNAVNELQLGTVPLGNTTGGNTRLRLYAEGRWQINPWDGASGFISTPSGQADFATMKIYCYKIINHFKNGQNENYYHNFI